MGKEFQTCKMKSYENLLHNDVNILNNTDCTLKRG